MLELVARLWARTNGVNNFAAADHARQSRPSVDAWRRLFGTQIPHKPRGKHLFAIERSRSGTARHPYNYRYYCVRCRWAFRVDGRGGVGAVDNQDRPLEGEVAVYRLKTFPKGPCGAHWASSAVIDGGRKTNVQESSNVKRTAPLTLVGIRRSAFQ